MSDQQNQTPEEQQNQGVQENGLDPAVEQKIEERGQAGSPVAHASDINSLGYTDEDVDPAAAGSDQVQDRIDQENEHGMRGIKVDPTPNEHYTVAGVTSGAPTPETDQSLRADIVAARHLDGPRPLR